MNATAVIGAGMAGLAAANALAAEGREVRVFDKSRGTGGRLATRRTDMGHFDHGAPIAQGAAAFDAALTTFGGAVLRVDDGWRGVPGMSGLVAPLTAGCDIAGGRRIVAVEGGAGAWTLRDGNGREEGPFAQVAAAIPAPQLVALLPGLEDRLSRVEMDPCWTLMARRPEGMAPRAPAAPVTRLIEQPGQPGALVAHAGPGWSREMLERRKEDVCADLLAALGLEGAPFAVAHRWRYARTRRALGVPCLDLGGGLVAGGDWALGPDAGDAWTSGRAMAAALSS